MPRSCSNVAKGDATQLALERARLAIYRGDCDRAAAALSAPTLAEAPGGAPLSALAESCARATVSGFVVEDEKLGVWVRLQDDADRAFAPFVIETAARARDAIAAELDVAFPRPLRIDLVRDLFSLAAVSGLPLSAAETTGTLAVARWGRVIAITPRATPLGYPWQDTLAHEITHLIVTRASTDRAPLWLQEGIAKREETRWRPARAFDDASAAQQLAFEALLTGRFIGLDELGPSIAMLPSPEQASVAYAEVQSFVTYWLALNGSPALRLLFSDMAETSPDSADPALRSVSGYGLGDWSRLWKKSMLDVPPRDPREARSRPAPVKDPRALARRVRLGDLLAERGRAAAAQVEYDAALALGSAEASVRYRAARTAMVLGTAAEASTRLGTLSDIRGPHGGWMALRGRLDADAGHAEEARAELEHALGLDPLDSTVACEGGIEGGVRVVPKDPRRRALCESAREAAPKKPEKPL